MDWQYPVTFLCDKVGSTMTSRLNIRTSHRLVLCVAALTASASLASADLNSFAIDLIETNDNSAVFKLGSAKTLYQSNAINAQHADGLPGALHSMFNQGASGDSLVPSFVPDSGTYLSHGEGGNGQIQAGNTSAMNFTKGSQMISAPLPSGALAGLGLLGSFIGIRAARRR